MPAEENGTLLFFLGAVRLVGIWILLLFSTGESVLGTGLSVPGAQRKNPSQGWVFALELGCTCPTGPSWDPLVWVLIRLIVLKLNEMKSNYLFNLYSRGKANLKKLRLQPHVYGVLPWELLEEV